MKEDLVILVCMHIPQLYHFIYSNTYYMQFRLLMSQNRFSKTDLQMELQLFHPIITPLIPTFFHPLTMICGPLKKLYMHVHLKHNTYTVSYQTLLLQVKFHFMLLLVCHWYVNVYECLRTITVRCHYQLQGLVLCTQFFMG